MTGEIGFGLNGARRNVSAGASQRLIDVLRASPYVSCCDVITGDTDILACLNVADMEEFREVTRDFMRRCPIIKTYRSITVAQHVKLQPTLAFDEE